MFTVSTHGFSSFWAFERVFLLEEAWFSGVKGFGGCEGALASTLIILLRYILL